jgi:hypothetical protein
MEQIRQFAQSSFLAGRVLTIRLFNANKHNLEYLQGRRGLDARALALVRPVLGLVAYQSAVIRQQGPMVNLELHWIPGHDHPVQLHINADTYSRTARLRNRAYSTVTGSLWHRGRRNRLLYDIWDKDSSTPPTTPGSTIPIPGLDFLPMPSRPPPQ